MFFDVKQHLENSPEVTALIGDRIYPVKLPPKPHISGYNILPSERLFYKYKTRKIRRKAPSANIMLGKILYSSETTSGKGEAGHGWLCKKRM